MISRATEFLANVRGELNKVTWPTKKDTYGSTLVVIVLVIVVAAFLYVVDFTLSTLIRAILR